MELTLSVKRDIFFKVKNGYSLEEILTDYSDISEETLKLYYQIFKTHDISERDEIFTKKRFYTSKEKEQIVSDFLNGMSSFEVAVKYKMKGTTLINKWARQMERGKRGPIHGDKKKERLISEQERNSAVVLDYKNGLTEDELFRKYNLRNKRQVSYLVKLDEIHGDLKTLRLLETVNLNVKQKELMVKEVLFDKKDIVHVSAVNKLRSPEILYNLIRKEEMKNFFGND